MAYLQARFYLGVSTAVGLLLFLCTSVAMAEELPPPERAIQNVSQSLKGLLQESQVRIKTDAAFVYQLADDAIAPHIDFNKLSSLALGKHWRRATPVQKKEFTHQFQRLLVRTYATAFREFGDWSLRFLSRHDVADAKSIMVRSEVSRPGAPPVSVNYRMHQKAGKWLAYDVVIEGISLVTNYRSTFAKEVRRNGMNGLIKRVTRLNNRRIAAAQQAAW